MITHTEATKGLAHHPIIEQAIGYIENMPLVAVDCACGAGNESAFLLSQNYQVYAFDVADLSKETCLERFKDHENYHFIQQSFEHYNFPSTSLIVALLSLFFCQPMHFQRIFNAMCDALTANGILVLDLLGEQDAWVKNNPQRVLGFSQNELDYLFGYEFEILHYEEMLGDWPMANGQVKFWHKHRLILRKK